MITNRNSKNIKGISIDPSVTQHRGTHYEQRRFRKLFHNSKISYQYAQDEDDGDDDG